MSFTNKIVESNGKYIFYITATDINQKRVWYFVQVHPDKLNAFKIALKQGAYSISDYGDVIKSGFGLAASSDIIDKINRKYKSDFS